MELSQLSEKAENYAISTEEIQARENDLQLFLKRFPLEKFNSLTIDEYAAGTGQDSFCYWIEFKKIGAGIGGGNASKFLVYKPSNETGDHFATGYGSTKKILNRKEAVALFDGLKEKIQRAFEYVQNDQVEKISELDIPIWNMVLQKILCLYFPDKFLPINSGEVIVKCARALGVDNFELKSSNLIVLNRECKRALLRQPEFRDWSDEKLGLFMWETFHEPNASTQEGPRYWLYAPGERARLWDIFYEKGIMGMGWDKLGDFRKFKTREDIKKALFDQLGGDGSMKNDVSAVFDFTHTMRIGDCIIVKKGVSELLGYGIVTSDMNHDNTLPEYHNIRSVDWKAIGNWPLDFRMVIKTLTDITAYKSEHPDYNFYYQRLLGIMNNNMEHVSLGESKSFPLNTIFYGPPGTGKTYHTVQRAAEIVTNRTVSKHKEALEIFNSHLHDQIEFITFHQNYSYEDFIQGLRPDTENDEQLTFERKDGIFKAIADKALLNLKQAKKTSTYKKSFDEVFNDFVNPLLEGEVEEIEIRMKKASFFITGVTGKSIQFRKPSGGTAHTLSIATLRKMYTREDELQIQGLASYYNPLLRLLLTAGNSVSAITEIGIRKNYVIIIDEINRANISRVFGELITLIEPDKRSEGSIPLAATLPSGDTFMIPSNLYIIGTMNTADKSIALLDIALRRRFEFEAMYPKYEIDGKPIEDAEILRKINDRIISGKGYDFQIGHAYFMNQNESLAQRMNNRVIPLLLEYYMNDEKEVRSILGEAGIHLQSKAWPLRVAE